MVYGPNPTGGTGQVCFSGVATGTYDVWINYPEFGNVKLGSTTVSCPQSSIPTFKLCDWGSIPATLTLVIAGHSCTLTYQTGGPLGDGWSGCMITSATVLNPGAGPTYCGTAATQVNIYWILKCDPSLTNWSIGAFVPACGSVSAPQAVDIPCASMFGSGATPYVTDYSCAWFPNHLTFGDAFLTCNPFLFQFTIAASQSCNSNDPTGFAERFLGAAHGVNVQGTVS